MNLRFPLYNALAKKWPSQHIFQIFSDVLSFLILVFNFIHERGSVFIFASTMLFDVLFGSWEIAIKYLLPDYLNSNLNYVSG